MEYVKGVLIMINLYFEILDYISSLLPFIIYMGDKSHSIDIFLEKNHETNIRLFKAEIFAVIVASIKMLRCAAEFLFSII